MTTFKPSRPKHHPRGASRRQVLVGFGTGAVALAGGRALAGSEGDEQVAVAPKGNADQLQRQSFYGIHQAGITTARPAAGLVTAFDLIVQSPDDLETMLRLLTERISFLMHGGETPTADPKLPPPDSGILGPVIEPDNLTITVSFGASLFEGRPWLAPLKPRQLVRMTQFPNDALDRDICHGDLAIQFNANLQDTNIHALRDIVKNLSQFMVLRWSQEGSVPVAAPMEDGREPTARNFLGFHDGSANPNSTDTALMNEIVWVGPHNDEPEWAHGGTYQAVRIIRNFVERWDRTPLREQEEIFGRAKATGAPLGAGPGATEYDTPDYASDPDGAITPLDAHIRLANPRTRASEENLILRRAFNYSNGVASSGQLDQGLLFIAYQADLEKGFIAVQNRLNGEPLEEYIKPVGGGYFYALPGVRDPGDYLGRSLVEAVRRRATSPS
ncbi:iron uptake transporter deferrochelatase/peroxidase subunit [Acuticoccus mangrovi]|uniref:Deferrochelatase n=1 Tax=Acuticoccus mangrovi TaxID=2796142 RepID=A0A934IQX3_9HYPH|nr:iron uptake transporter deferrochelatase/peroxidase subunit [Acuticoccus mangrovi]MBJ3778457.1 deferrochelatase/peroxidase EfeB [Acuticoccus mangrovi]